ncbi:transposase [Streptomyces sp. NPDC048057]|uniref:IS701 family transposase n=1 Tax=Streptomyces sp. NPDC048057 TaxID=3155628 RepID=UPI0033C8DF75
MIEPAGPVPHTGPVPHARPVPRVAPAPRPAGLFASLRRRDQRTTAELYLAALLATDGRKSVRNLSTAFGAGAGAAEQRLHHFVAGSTWDWRPVRGALVDALGAAVPRHAWVVRALPIPKAGTHSVGVDRQYVPGAGRQVHGQLAFGLWFVSAHLTAPVGWRLFLPPRWLDDAERRARADVPASAVPESPGECAARAALPFAARGAGARPPVVVGHVVDDPAAVVDVFARAGVPFVARIDVRTRLVAADREGAGAGGRPARAEQVLRSAPGPRRPVERPDPSRGRRTSWLAATPVRLPDRPRPLLLLGEWDDPRHPPVRLWLTDATDTPAPLLVRLTASALRVPDDGGPWGARVGLRDFEGRSFPGWHRHMTLASVAYALAAGARDLSAQADAGPAQSLRPSA